MPALMESTALMRIPPILRVLFPLFIMKNFKCTEKLKE